MKRSPTLQALPPSWDHFVESDGHLAGLQDLSLPAENPIIVIKRVSQGVEVTLLCPVTDMIYCLKVCVFVCECAVLSWFFFFVGWFFCLFFFQFKGGGVLWWTHTTMGPCSPKLQALAPENLKCPTYLVFVFSHKLSCLVLRAFVLCGLYIFTLLPQATIFHPVTVALN